MTATDKADLILRDAHFNLFNDVCKLRYRSREYQRGIKALRTLEHAVSHLTGKVFTACP